MTWEKDGSTIEIRTQGELADERPALDEIVASGADVHLEQMDHDQWWMSINCGRKALPSLVHPGRWPTLRSPIGSGR
jgi:hypothetical protein